MDEAPSLELEICGFVNLVSLLAAHNEDAQQSISDL